MTQFNAEELAQEYMGNEAYAEHKGLSWDFLEEISKVLNQAYLKGAEDAKADSYTAGYNKAVEDAVAYMKAYARNMEEPMCEYTHTQNEAQKYILNRVSKALNKLKKG